MRVSPHGLLTCHCICRKEFSPPHSSSPLRSWVFPFSSHGETKVVSSFSPWALVPSETTSPQSCLPEDMLVFSHPEIPTNTKTRPTHTKCSDSVLPRRKRKGFSKPCFTIYCLKTPQLVGLPSDRQIFVTLLLFYSVSSRHLSIVGMQ